MTPAPRVTVSDLAKTGIALTLAAWLAMEVTGWAERRRKELDGPDRTAGKA